MIRRLSTSPMDSFRRKSELRPGHGAGSSSPATLNLGCGDVRLPDSLGVDMDHDSCADVIYDLNRYPWPFPDESYPRVLCSHALEHLRDPSRAVEEMHRVCKRGGTVEIETPHYSSPDSWNDPTHIYHFGLGAFRFFYGEGRRKPLFRLLERRITFGKGVPSLLGAAAVRLFGLRFYEKYLAFLLPARNIKLRLEKI